MGQQTYFAIFAPPGRLAQLVQSTRLHRGGRGFESLTAHSFKSPCHAGVFCALAQRWSHADNVRRRTERPSTRRRPQTNFHPPTPRLPKKPSSARVPMPSQDGRRPRPQPRSKLGDCTCAGMARGMSAAHHTYDASSGNKAIDFAVVFVRHCAPNHRQSASAFLSKFPQRLYRGGHTVHIVCTIEHHRRCMGHVDALPSTALTGQGVIGQSILNGPFGKVPPCALQHLKDSQRCAQVFLLTKEASTPKCTLASDSTSHA